MLFKPPGIPAVDIPNFLLEDIDARILEIATELNISTGLAKQVHLLRAGANYTAQAEIELLQSITGETYV